MFQLAQRARTVWIFRSLHFTWQHFREWWESQGMWWSVSVTAHAVVLSTVLLLMGSYTSSQPVAPATFISVNTAIPSSEQTPLELSPVIEQPTTVVIDSTPLETDPDTKLDSLGLDTSASASNEIAMVAPSAGGELSSLGALKGKSGSPGTGEWTNYGSAREGERGQDGNQSFKRRVGRGKGIIGGHTPQTDRAVSLALSWLARHQEYDGRWSLSQFARQCTDGSCACNAGDSDTAATALGLLPFLATGQTHKTKGRYKQNMFRGLTWLVAQQKSDGDLRSGSGTMYSHGLATIALCEAYGLSDDERIGSAAQQAINFIVTAQDPVGGGWRYEPKQPGDLSVVGWQLMALKSGMMAGLSVPSDSLERAARFVKSVSNDNGGFGYQEPGSALAMSAVGLLCTQYLGANRDDRTIRGGSQLLLANQPSNEAKNTYYWYYATQVMHNLYDADWDTWNRRMRRVLVESQETKGCAAGSWSPDGHPFADQGGRLMVTALNTLSLEVYYRYLPLYKLGR